jgi:hypothetical protein
MSRKPNVRSNITLEDIDPVLKRFLDSQTEKTKKTYGYMMKKLLEFTGSQTGSQMLKDRKIWHKKITEFLQWMKAQGYSDAYATTACAMVRGFFSHERKPLELIRQEKLRLSERTRADEDYLFSREDVSKMKENGSQKEKYVLLVGASFGLRAEDFANITYGQYRMALGQSVESPIYLGKISTLKEKGVYANPFISSDALPIIQAYLDANKDKEDSEKVWNERPEQLTTVLQTLFKKTGLDSHGQLVRFHNLRKYLIDRISAVASESQWKQIVGKKIKEGAYVSTDQLQGVYLKALPEIVCSNGNAQVKALDAKLNITEEELLRKIKERDDRIDTLEARLKAEADLHGRATDVSVRLMDKIEEAGGFEKVTSLLEQMAKVETYQDEEKKKAEITEQLDIKKADEQTKKLKKQKKSEGARG